MRNGRGKYIANLPGDDYWTGPLKLQKQVDILDKHSNIIVCHHWHSCKNENSIIDVGTPKDGYLPQKVASVKEIFANKLRLKSRTIMFRNIIYDNFFPEWFYKVAFGDVPLSFLLGQHGDFYFIDEPMSVYRITVKDVSTAVKSGNNIHEWRIKHFQNWIEIWNYANKHYNYKYNKEAYKTIQYFSDIIVKNIIVIEDIKYER